MPTPPPAIAVEDARKVYASPRGGVTALDGLSLTVAEGEFVAILGPSGCGKTTLLRVLAGLETPDGGAVRYRGESLAGAPPHARPFGFVFQQAALFPHLTVADNVAFGLAVRGRPKAAQRERVDALLELVGLAGYGPRRVNELSGGEAQRVALARALAPEPPALLMDEPLSALDRELRERLRREVRDIHRRLGLTTLYVTHDQEEALALADRIVLMRAGRIVQEGPPGEVLARPATAWAARFLGAANALPATVAGTKPLALHTPLGRLTHGEGGVRLDAPDGLPEGSEAWLLAPPASLEPAASGGVAGRVLEARPLGPATRLAVSVAGDVWEAEAPAGRAAPRPGDGVRLRVAEGAYRVVTE